MANVDIQNKGSSQTARSQTGQSLTPRDRGEHGALSRSGGFDPFSSLSPGEFFINPFSAMRRMSDEMDRAFGRFLGQGGAETMAGFPAIEVAEHDGSLCVHADVPGLKPEDVKVEVTQDSLIIRGERKSEHEHRGKNTYRSERHYGEFYREIPLPQGANTEQAKANFTNGVLEITVPVPQQASKRREIPVQTGSGRSTGTASAAAAGAGRSSPQTK
ncbi:MAG: Hsp20/alpha crystallin family protein [Bryobacteraceae bacterium]